MQDVHHSNSRTSTSISSSDPIPSSFTSEWSTITTTTAPFFEDSNSSAAAAYLQRSKSPDDQGDGSKELMLLAILIPLSVCVFIVVFLFAFMRYHRKFARTDLVEEHQIFIDEGPHKGTKSYDYYVSYFGHHSKLVQQPAELALSIHEALTEEGLTGVFRLTNDVFSGSEMRAIIKNSRVVVAILHDETYLSDTCRLEWQIAEETSVPVLCIADLQNFNLEILEQQVQDVAEYLLQYPWQNTIAKYKHARYNHAAEFILQQPSKNTSCFLPVLPGAPTY
jgi:hypothetical protein